MFIREIFEDTIVFDDFEQESVKIDTADGGMVLYPLSIAENAVNNYETQTGEWKRICNIWSAEGRF